MTIEENSNSPCLVVCDEDMVPEMIFAYVPVQAKE